jgi:DNA mismatch repair protein MutL
LNGSGVKATRAMRELDNESEVEIYNVDFSKYYSVEFDKNSTDDETIMIYDGTYEIVVELGDSVFFIDQHASHERTLYDKLRKEIDEKEVVKQDLLVPYTFSVGIDENQYIDKNLDTLRSLGFDIQEVNHLKYEISSAPLVLADISLKNFIEGMLVEGAYLSSQPSDILKDKLAQSACKHAIKGGDALTKDQILYIIEQMKKGVLLCPHGRPIVLELTKKDIEKMFKRIV